MKRINALLVALAIGMAAISLWGCNANDSVEMRNEVRTVEIESSVPEIVRALEAYNASLLEEMGPQTRLSERDWKVIGADARGAYKGAQWGSKIGSLFGPHGSIGGGIIGGILCGGVASVAKWKLESRMAETYFSVYDDMLQKETIYEVGPLHNKYLKITDEQIAAEIARVEVAFAVDSVFLQVGALHNLICDELKKPAMKFELEPIDGSDIIVNAGGGLMPPGGDDGTLVPGGFYDPVLYSSEFQAKYRSFVEESVNNPSNTEFDSDDDSVATQTASLFLEACNTFVHSMNNLYNIVNHYYNTVENSSELTRDEKDCLICMFAVAEYSGKYWGLK